MKFSSKVFFSLISATFIFAAGCDDSTTKCTAKCDGQTAYSCDKNGKETKTTCKADQTCKVDTKANTATCNAKGGNGGGGNNGGGNTGTEPQKDAECTKDSLKTACNEAKDKGWRCSVKKGETKGKVFIQECPQKNCQVDDTGWLSCGPKSGNSGEECNKKTYKSKCSDDKKEGYFCGNKGTVVTKKCPNSDCNVSKTGFVDCGTGGGNGGGGTGGGAETCDPKTYTSQCAEDQKSGTFCNKDGKIGKVNCPNSDCMVSPTGFVSCGEPKSDVYVDCVLDKHKAKCKDLKSVKCMVKDKDVNNENNARVVCFKDPEDKCENDANDKCELVEGKAINDKCYFRNYPLKKDGLRSLQVCAKGCADNNKKCKE